jgi:hypothetical protein
MLHLRDGRTGHMILVPHDRSRLLRILVAPERHDDLTVLRTALVADLVRRVTELRGAQPAVVTDGQPPGLIDYNIHPASSADRAQQPDIVVGQVERARVSLIVGAVAGMIPGSVDPLAARLALLSTPYADPVQLDASRLRAADKRLHTWRALVRHWAEAPSQAMPAPYVDDAWAAIDDDLHVPRIIDLLDRAAVDGSVADGSRFELSMHLDRVLGLDLAVGIRRVNQQTLQR